MWNTKRLNSCERLVLEMLKTNTGIAMCDSGGDNGRHWQRNQTRDFVNESPVEVDIYEDEVLYTINIYHYMIDKLEVDEICKKYNKLKCEDWDGAWYWISESQTKWLEKRFDIWASWNTYNGDSRLSQDLQTTSLLEINSSNYEYPEYILIQIHQGCDIRGWYTDAKMFRIKSDTFLSENVYWTLHLKNWQTYSISNSYDGCSLRLDDDGRYQDLKIEDFIKNKFENVNDIRDYIEEIELYISE